MTTNTAEVRTCPRCGITRTVRPDRPTDALCRTCMYGPPTPTTAPDWTDAACVGHDTDLWYPTGGGRGNPADWDTPRLLCRACPVRHACLEWATSNPDPTLGEGLWGGLTPRERSKLRREAAA